MKDTPGRCDDSIFLQCKRIHKSWLRHIPGIRINGNNIRTGPDYAIPEDTTLIASPGIQLPRSRFRISVEHRAVPAKYPDKIVYSLEQSDRFLYQELTRTPIPRIRRVVVGKIELLPVADTPAGIIPPAPQRSVSQDDMRGNAIGNNGGHRVRQIQFPGKVPRCRRRRRPPQIPPVADPQIGRVEPPSV